MTPPSDHQNDDAAAERPDPFTHPALAPYADAIRATILPYVGITVREGARPGLFDSKFGGEPYLPRGTEIPKGSDGANLHLLAQLDFDEIPRLDGFPETGILQFYISEQDGFGADFDHGTNQADFRVLYWPTVDRDDAITDFSFLHKPSWSPLDQDAMPLALAFTLGREPVLPSDFRFEAHFEDPSDAFLDPYIEFFPRYGDVHQIGGYSSFCQDDPRPRAGPDHLIQLLQVDSGVHIDWGDGGTANFFIRQQDLARRDFSSVLYTWDCL